MKIPSRNSDAESLSLARRDLLGAFGVSIALFSAGCFEDRPADDGSEVDGDEEGDETEEDEPEPDSSEDEDDEEDGTDDEADSEDDSEDDDEEGEEAETSEADVDEGDEESEADEDEEEGEDEENEEEGEDESEPENEEEEEGEDDDEESEDDADEEQGEDEENEGFTSPDALDVLGIHHEDEEFSSDRVQLYNSGDDPVDISGWEFDTGITTVTVGADTTAAPNNNTYIRLADSGEDGLDPDGGTLTITQADGSSFGSFDYDADPNAEDESEENGEGEEEENGAD